ncbi:MAG: hypothetical protein FJ147_07525 [Deltaproteobacteria bacterium]|nr:hypothetical protein [Deltaproteobacteria bacterium]
MKKLLWSVLVLGVIGLTVGGWWYLRLRSAAQQWEGPVAEILSEKLEKDTDTMTIEFTSRVDAPVATVFRAFTEPERSKEFSDAVRYAKLLGSEDNRKTVELEMVILGQPQRMILEFTFIEAENRVALKTVENQFSELTGQYRLTSSPDGTKTLVTYSGIAKDKAKLPVPLALQKSALRETFVSTIRALKKGLAAQQAQPQPTS